MKYLILLLICLCPLAASADSDSYCARLGEQVFNDCKQGGTDPNEYLKTCSGERDETKKSCATQITRVKFQVGFLNYMDPQKYSSLNTQLASGLSSTELSEEALNSFAGDNNFNQEISGELSKLDCLPPTALSKPGTLCPLPESDYINIYPLASTEYLVMAYSASGSSQINNAYNLYVMQGKRLYPLGSYYEVKVDAPKHVLSTTTKALENGASGGISFYKIDNAGHKLNLLKNFNTIIQNDAQGQPGYISEDKSPDTAGGYMIRADQYSKKMKFNLYQDKL